MISAAFLTFSLALLFILETSAVPRRRPKNLAVLIEEFEELEDDRRNLMKNALETSELSENRSALKYLVRLAEAHITLVSLRRYFEAADKVFRTIHSLKSKGEPPILDQVAEEAEEESVGTSKIENDFLKNQLTSLSKTYAATSDVEVWNMPYIVRSLLLPVSYAFIHSEEKLLELVLRFQSELDNAWKNRGVLLVDGSSQKTVNSVLFPPS